MSNDYGNHIPYDDYLQAFSQRPIPDGAWDAFTLLTTEPGPDVAPIYDRQTVVLERADWSAWLDHSRPEGELLRALPAGSLKVEQVR